MMSKKAKSEKLFHEFPSVSTSEWEEIILKDLKGADYEKKLVWNTNEGFKVKPYYRAEDIADFNHLNTLPGQFPYVRGNKSDSNNWLVRQDIVVEDVKTANKKALFLLSRGIESLGFILTSVITPKQFNELLDEIVVEAVEINLICGSHFEEILKNFISVLSKKNINFKNVHGSITYNPMTDLALTGIKNEVEEAKVIIEMSKDLPNFRTLIVHGSIFHNAGATTVEELGFALSMAAEYLNQLTELGLTIDELSPKLKFEFAIGSNYFMEIAKIRAARLLWAKMIEAHKPMDKSVAKMFVHSTTSDWNKTMYDPHVNMLRTTTEAMSSVLGGTDSLIVNAYNEIFENPTDFSERIARNQQLLLKEESYLDKVADPAAGSYYIESLTASIAENAWKLFLEAEEKGGFMEAMKSGFIQEKIKSTAQKRDMDIANRKEILLGTNQYPNFNEVKTINLDEDLFKSTDLSDEKAEIETLKPYRGAQAFEALRYKTDLYTKNHKRPLAFMLTYGNVAMRKARATFASNFFACAGFDVKDNIGFKSAEEGVKAAAIAGAEIIVICSSDDEYAELAPKVKKLAADKMVVVAGYPKEILEDLKSKGIQDFIHIKSNVLETLADFQRRLGIR